MWRKAYWKKGISVDRTEWLPGITPAEECMVRVRRNDWVQAKNQISRSYLEMFRNAYQRITIMSSYFLPGKIFRKQMPWPPGGSKGKNNNGGVSDVRIARLAEQYMYRGSSAMGSRSMNTRIPSCMVSWPYMMGHGPPWARTMSTGSALMPAWN